MAKKNARAKGTKNSKSGVAEEEKFDSARAVEALERAEADAERKARRAQARREMRERFAEAFIGLARFLWERSWAFSVPAALLLALALGTYSPDDPAFSVATARTPANFCGVWGAWCAEFLLGIFGLSAWWFVLGLVMVAFFAFRSKLRAERGETNPERINPPKFTAFFGLCALMIGSTAFEAMRIAKSPVMLPGNPGGILGNTRRHALCRRLGCARRLSPSCRHRDFAPDGFFLDRRGGKNRPFY